MIAFIMAREARPREPLYTLREAARILNGKKVSMSGRVTPATPFGQCTVRTPDGRLACCITGEVVDAPTS